MPPASKKQKDAEEAPEIKTGIYIFSNADKYDGEYIRSSDGGLERTGTGMHTSCDGTIYEGQWKNDKMDGNGRIQFPSGATYEGNFEENKFHGNGRYVWPNGSLFEGTFTQNKMEGEGQFTDTDGQVWCGNFWYKAAPGLRFKLSV